MITQKVTGNVKAKLLPMLQGLQSAKKPTEQPAQTVPPSVENDPDTDPDNPDYESPDDGPFRCDNCSFFSAPSQCSQEKVVASQQGIVDPAGCCKFFDSLTASQGQNANGTK